MSMKLTAASIADLSTKLDTISSLNVEVTQIVHDGHNVFLRKEKGELMIIGITDKVSNHPVMR